MGIDFDAVYNAHVPLMIGIAVERFQISQTDAQTLAHQIFLIYFLKPDDVKDVRAWFVGAISNACRQYLRNRERDVDLSPEIMNQPDPEFPSDWLPNRLAARQAFACLTSRCQMVTRFSMKGQAPRNTCELAHGRKSATHSGFSVFTTPQCEHTIRQKQSSRSSGLITRSLPHSFLMRAFFSLPFGTKILFR